MFIDYAFEAFDTVTHRALWDTLIGFGVPKHLVWLKAALSESSWRGEGVLVSDGKLQRREWRTTRVFSVADALLCCWKKDYQISCL